MSSFATNASSRRFLVVNKLSDIDESEPKSASKGSLLAIFLTVFVDLLGFGIVLPLLPLYARQFADEHQWTPSQANWAIALLMSSFSAMQFLFAPLWGRLSDRIGRRPVLMIGLVGSTASYFLFGLSAQWGSIVGLFVSRIGAGIAGGTISTAQAYIADTTTTKNRAKGMAMIGAAFALGFTLGPLLAAAAILFGGELAFSPWPGYVAACLSGLALGVAVFLLPESLTPGADISGRPLFELASLGSAVRIPTVGALLASIFLGVFSFASFESTLSLEIAELSPPAETELDREANAATAKQSNSTGDAGSPVLARMRRWLAGDGRDARTVSLATVCFTFAYLGVVMTLAQGFLVRRLASRLSEGVLAVSGAALSIAGFLLLAKAAAQSDFTLLLAAMAVESIGFALVSPSLQSLLSRRAPVDRQGEILGVGQSVSALARIFGPVCGVRLFYSGPATPFLTAAAVTAACLALIVMAAARGADAAGQAK